MRRLAIQFTPHLERYAFAMPYVQDKRTLDAGGKTGYGCEIMSYVSGPLTLVDKEQYLLDKSRVKDKIQCDFEKDFPAGQWEAIVAFEIIEHVEDPDFFVKNMVDHLEPGGVLVFSAPHMKEDPSHKTLFDGEGIRRLISKYLPIIEFYIQDSYGISGKPFKSYPVTYVGVAKKL